jgi:hypothetical protein
MSTTTTTTTGNAYVFRRSSVEGELPILVGIFAILIGLLGLFFVVVGVLLIGTSLGILATPGVGAYGVISGDVLIAGLVTLIFGAVLVTVATGLWDLETWALVVAGAVVTVLVVLLVVAGDFGWTLLFAAGLLLYLFAVRGHFY